MDEGYNPERLMLEKILLIQDSAQPIECHGCGEFGDWQMVYMQHLCQHYFAVCPKCLKLLKKKLAKA